MKKQVKNGALRLFGNLLLVFLGLFGGVYALTDPFELVFSPAVFGVVCLSAALCALIHSQERGRLRLMLCLLVCLFCAFVLWRQWDSVFLGAQVVFHKVSLAFHQELPQVLYYELPTPLTEAQMTDYASAFVMALTPLLSLWLGLWLVRGRTVIPAVVTVCALSGVSIGILREPGTLSLGATLLFLSLTALSCRGYRQSATLGARRVLTAAVPVCLVMALLCALFPQQSYTRPRWAEDLRLRAKATAQSWVFQKERANEPGTYLFRRFGAPSFDGHTVLTVKTEEAGRLLLRGWSSARYTQYGWQGLEEQALEGLPAADQERQSWAYPAHAALDSGFGGTGRTVEIMDVSSGSDYYYTPYFPTSMYTGADYHADAYFQRQAHHYTYQFDFIDSDEMPAGAQVGWDGGARYQEPAYRDFVYAHYLDVPYEALSDEALAIIHEAARAADGDVRADGDTTVSVSYSYPDQRAYQISRASKVAEYLASFTSYDLGTPAQPLGEDFVSYFLTTSHRGYCAHYATAATLILREMGVPARFVSGYAVDATGGEEPAAVPDRNAHAWVEIYVDGFGWQPVDVTPAGAFPAGGAEDTPEASPSPSALPGDEPASATPGPTEPPSPTPSASGQTGQGPAATGPAASGPALGLLWWALGLGALASALLLRRRLLLRRWRRRCGQESANAAALWLYRYLERVEKRLALPPPEAARALAQKAAFSQHTLTARERRTMEDCARQAHAAALAAPVGKRLLLRWVWCLC